MRDRYLSSCFRSWPVWVVLLFTVFGGCQAKKPPLSPAATAFKKEVRDCFQRIVPALVGPVVKKNLPAINQVLKNLEPETKIKLCIFCPFRIGVLDRSGDTLTIYPFKAEALGNYSTYDVVMQTLKNHRINQQRFFLQGGSEIYVICAPILKGKSLVGIVAMSLGVGDAQKHWGLTEKEFLALDFNKS
jgi:hypothetical protein